MCKSKKDCTFATMKLRHIIIYIGLLAGVFLSASAQKGIEKETDFIGDTIVQDSIKKPWCLRVKETMDSLLHTEMFKTSQVGLLVWDLDADTLFFAHNSQQTMRPASTMKLVTAITALNQMGGDYRLTTSLRMEGSVTDSTLYGDLVVEGAMDPMLDKDDMRAFAQSVYKLGIDTIRGQLRADRSMKDNDLLGEGWCWDDDNPMLSPLVYQRKDSFLESFEQELQTLGIAVCPPEPSELPTTGYTPIKATTEKITQTVLCQRNHTVDQLLIPMMKESDNLYAEALFYHLAKAAGRKPATAKQSASIERQLIGKLGLTPSHYRIADGSGLSLYNYISPELLVRFLRYAYRNDQIARHLLPSLPVAGMDGTLKKRMTGTAAYGMVKAKTGTLSGVITLAGYATSANGQHLCFAILNQSILSASTARDFQDKICIALCSE